MEQMMTLYDYLGKAAGVELGRQVSKYAAIRQSKFTLRSVSNRVYTGTVMAYPKPFLDEFFEVQKIFTHKLVLPVEQVFTAKQISLERKVSEPQDNTLPF